MERIDVLLCNLNFFESRAKAKQAIADGCIEVNGELVTKSSLKVDESADIKIVKEPLKYVSRGALKLLKAIDEFDLSFTDKVVCDIGASTGGFTEVSLEYGAKKVFSIDVGQDQLHQRLVNDDRVINMEQTNFRYVIDEDFDTPIDICVTDVSFISLKLILVPIFNVLKEGGEAIVLVKPQFEAGKKHLNKHGVVRDKKIHKKVIDDIINYSKDVGFKIINIIDSPILGGDGNKEFLLYMKKMSR